MNKMVKIRLMQLCCSPSLGGLEMYFANISNALDGSFVVSNVVSPDSKVVKKLNTPLQALDKKFHYFPLLAAYKLAKIIDEQHIQIIHMHWNKDLTLAVFSKLLSKRKPKLVLTRHMQFPARKDSFFHRFLYRNIDHIVAVSQTMEYDLKRFIPEDVQPDISVNYLGIKPTTLADADEVRESRKKYAAEGTFLIGLFGRIDPYKGHDLLLDAMLIAKQGHLPFKALLVGHAMTDVYLQHLQHRVSNEGLTDYVEFTGFVNQPRTLMQACDTVILTTVEETFGLVLIEAMSVGVPVIGSDRGGVPEIIEHGSSGLLFTSEDSVSLFDALKLFYEQPKQAKKCAAAGMLVAKDKFSQEQHEQRLVDCLHALVQSA
ncbi:MAG: glycosyltransferase family 4 protein [Ghiorsea sp.]